MSVPNPRAAHGSVNLTSLHMRRSCPFDLKTTLFVGVLGFLTVVRAGQAQTPGPAVPPPVAPATIARDDHGQATIRAVRIAQPIQLDGRLDDEVYERTPPIDGFIQQEPREGALASENTQVWVFFDERNIYVSARCFDSHPEREVVTELRRDQNNITQNESFTIVFDTFLDRRNGLFFQTTPLGALRDQAIVDDVLNSNWNTVWDVRTSRFEGGWSAEFAIPFKSLRYPGPGPQVTVVDAAGTVLVTPALAIAAGGGSGKLRFIVTPDKTGQVSEWLATWAFAQGGVQQSVTTSHRVVGDVLFTLAEARTYDGAALANSATYSDAAILAARDRIADAFAEICGVAFGARYASEVAIPSCP